MTNELVTVVVPVYNVEKYLDRCVNSIVKQTYRNLEIILVDDGSPDNCPQMCDEWAKKDSRIRVIHKQNEGLSMARNTGIELAAGKYICFIDSDDYVDLNMVEEVYDVAERNCASVVCYGFKLVDTKGSVFRVDEPQPMRLLYEGESVRNELLPGIVGSDPKTGKSFRIYSSACSHFIAMDVIRKLGWRFVSERKIISEDCYAIIALYQGVERACIVPRSYYYYCENQVSITHTYRSDRYRKICEYYTETIKLCDTIGYNDDVKYRVGESFLSFVIAALKQEVQSERKFWEKYASVRNIVYDDMLYNVISARVGDKIGIKKKILFWACKNKQVLLVYVLLKGQISLKRK